VRCWRLAAAGTAGPRRMGVDEAAPSQSWGLLPSGGTDLANGVAVEAMALADILDRVRLELSSDRIDFLKMDIEGGEHECFAATPPAALSCVRNLGIEYHPGAPRERLFEVLARAGFRCTRDVPIGADCGVAHFTRKGA